MGASEPGDQRAAGSLTAAAEAKVKELEDLKQWLEKAGLGAQATAMKTEIAKAKAAAPAAPQPRVLFKQAALWEEQRTKEVQRIERIKAKAQEEVD
eukprot:5851679-Alexandrium_andersonii.AAC.1